MLSYQPLYRRNITGEGMVTGQPRNKFMLGLVLDQENSNGFKPLKWNPWSLDKVEIISNE